MMVLRDPRGARKLFDDAGSAQRKIEAQMALAASLQKEAKKNRPVFAARRKLLRMRAKRILKAAFGWKVSK